MVFSFVNLDAELGLQLGGVFADQSAAVILIYLLAIISLGAFGARMESLEDFHLAGESFGFFC